MSSRSRPRSRTSTACSNWSPVRGECEEPMSVTDATPIPVGRLGFARHEDVDLFVQRLEAFERGELDADGWRSFRLLNGVYGQRQDGVMMIRAKLPAGIATP